MLAAGDEMETILEGYPWLSCLEKHGTSIATIRALPRIDAEISADPMPSDCERIIDSVSGWLVTKEK